MIKDYGRENKKSAEENQPFTDKDKESKDRLISLLENLYSQFTVVMEEIYPDGSNSKTDLAYHIRDHDIQAIWESYGNLSMVLENLKKNRY